jgi:hypothetical protein
MRDKKKRTEKQIKVPDLKPKKDAKGGRKAGGDPPTVPTGPKVPPGANT